MPRKRNRWSVNVTGSARRQGSSSSASKNPRSLVKQTQDTIAQKVAEVSKQREEALMKIEQERSAHEKELAQLHKHKESLTGERDKALALQKEAIEAKRAQWVVFGKEYTQTVRQRDEALTQLSDAKVELRKKADALTKEKDAMLAKLRNPFPSRRAKPASSRKKSTTLRSRTKP